MDVERFFELFINEIRKNPALRHYYRFLNKSSLFWFRKAYFCQRLDYIYQHLPPPPAAIWDCGCGYGTTGIFLALNGYNIYGNTLEYYYNRIPERLKYWKEFGDLTGFKVDYKDIFELRDLHHSFDYIIAQDTLHHLEPVDDAIEQIAAALKPSGKLIAIEENGNNIIQNIKLFLQRGNKKIIEIHDEKLDKKILLGNEHIRTLSAWKQILNRHDLNVNDSSIEYVRLFPPFLFKGSNYQNRISQEKRIWKHYPFLKHYFYQGINFMASKM